MSEQPPKFNPSFYRIPPGFEELLEGYVKEVIRFNPANIVDFSRDYFQGLLDGSLNEDSLQRRIEDHGYLKVQEDPRTADYAGFDDEGHYIEPSQRTRGRRPKEKKDGSSSHGTFQQPRQLPSSSSVPARQVDAKGRKRQIYTEAFRKIDVDHSGAIDMSELASLLTSIGWGTSKRELKLAQDALDTSGDGVIDLEEFLEWSEYAWENRVMKGGSMDFNRPSGRTKKYTPSMPQFARMPSVVGEEEEQGALGGYEPEEGMVLEEEEPQKEILLEEDEDIDESDGEKPLI